MLKVKTVYVLIVILKVLVGSILSYWLFKIQNESNTYTLMLTASMVALLAHFVSQITKVNRDPFLRSR
jgi:hypothetical protein